MWTNENESEAAAIEVACRQRGELAFYVAFLRFGANDALLDAYISECLNQVYEAFFAAGGGDGRFLGRAQEAYWSGFDAKRRQICKVEGHA